MSSMQKSQNRRRVLGALLATGPMQQLKAPLQSLLRTLGYELVRPVPSLEAVVMRLVARHGIDILIDVGANVGQYARWFRDLGFEGKIVSFEPSAEAYSVLERSAARDDKWSCSREALGDADVSATLHIAGNSVSSSLLTMTNRHLTAAPDSKTVATEKVQVRKLDSIATPRGRTWLKLDTQGYEMRVLRGATRTLERCDVIQLELSLQQLYEGAPSVIEVLTWLSPEYRIVWVVPGFVDVASGTMLQFDAILERV